MTKPQLLKEIDKHAKTGWICVDTIVWIADEKGKGYPFDKNGSKKHLEKVLNDLNNGYFCYPF